MRGVSVVRFVPHLTPFRHENDENWVVRFLLPGLFGQAKVTVDECFAIVRAVDVLH